MGCVASSLDPQGQDSSDVVDLDEMWETPTVQPESSNVRDVVLEAALHFVLAAGSMESRAALEDAAHFFATAYTTFINSRNLCDPAVAYVYAQAYVNAASAGAEFVDGPLDLLRDGVHRPFSARRRSF